MKKVLALTISVLLLCLCAACGEKGSAEPVQNPGNAAQSSPEQAEQPAGQSSAESTAAAESTAPAESTASVESEAPAESTAESIEETPEPETAVTLRFDPKAYPNPNDDKYYNVLTYGTNSGETPAMATIRYKAIDKDGNVLSVFNISKGAYSETFKTAVYIPAGTEDFPIAFTLPEGFRYDFTTGEEMPEIDHMDFELLEITDMDVEDLRDHFTSGEPEIRNNQLYIYVKFDQEIADNYSSLFPDYTLLGYSNGTLTTVYCTNYYPYSTSSVSVSYAKEQYDGSLLVYYDAPSEPVDKWELCLGCIGGQK